MAEEDDVQLHADDVIENLEVEATQDGEPPKGDDDPEETVVTFGEEPPPPEKEPAPEWVRDLRKRVKEQERELRELRQKGAQAAPATVTLGKKPSLEDFNWDAEKFEAALADWYERKRQIDEQQAAAERAEQEKAQQWQQRLQQYESGKESLKVGDFEDAEAAVLSELDEIQQSIILHAADNATVMVYALGRNPERLKELSKIKDPVLFAKTVGALETQLKVTSRKASPPPPERTVTAGAKGGTVDQTIERLEAEAERTGDFSKLFAYKRKLKQRA